MSGPQPVPAHEDHAALLYRDTEGHAVEVALPPAEVAVLASLPGPYTYLVPPALAAAMRVGTRVWVPFSAQRIEGVVLALPAGAPAAARPTST